MLRTNPEDRIALSQIFHLKWLKKFQNNKEVTSTMSMKLNLDENTLSNIDILMKKDICQISKTDINKTFSEQKTQNEFKDEEHKTTNFREIKFLNIETKELSPMLKWHSSSILSSNFIPTYLENYSVTFKKKCYFYVN